jgi:hypothetical protein
VIELRLHRDIYRAPAVDEAVGVFGSFATLERCDDAEHLAVRISGKSGERERRIAGELANYALGLTVGARKAGENGVKS